MAKNTTTPQSGVPGVHWDRSKERWGASIKINGKDKFLGSSTDLQIAIDFRLNAEKAILPTDQVKRAALLDKMFRIRMRAVWRDTLKLGPTTWSSFDHFLATVGERPKKLPRLGPVDVDVLMGPDNFKWMPPKHDLDSVEGRRKYSRAFRENNYDAYRDRELKKSFGIGIKEYREKLVEQNGVCACCKQPETTIRQGRLLALAVDHNHSTGQIRGLLCGSCNVALGMLKEDKNVIRSLLNYLDCYEVSEEKLLDNVVQLKI